MIGKKKNGEVNNSMGNGEAKELICMTHEHEIRWENAHGRGRHTGQWGIKGRKKTDKCNSIINKIYFKNLHFSFDKILSHFLHIITLVTINESKIGCIFIHLCHILLLSGRNLRIK